MPEQKAASVEGDTSVQNIPVPPSPQPIKSSNEILTELFGAFNATPPSLDEIIPQGSADRPLENTHKKHKKNYKKKHKKVKKRKHSSSSGSRSSSLSKRKLCKKHEDRQGSKLLSSESAKRKKKKLGKFSASDSEDEPKKKKIKCVDGKKFDIKDDHKVKIKKEKDDVKNKLKLKASNSVMSTTPDTVQESIFKDTVSRIVEKVIGTTKLGSEECSSTVVEKIICFPNAVKKEPDELENQVCNESKGEVTADSGTDKTSPLPVANVFAEDLIDCRVKKDNLNILPDKPKSGPRKITIKNLKFSQVYEATVKQIEEEARLKAERYEEGELSESTLEPERSPTPSGLSSSGSVEEKERRRRHHRRKEKHRHHHKKRSLSGEKISQWERSHSEQSKKCSGNRSRSRECQRSIEHDNSKDRSRSRERDRSKERSRSKERHISREREKSKYRSMSKEKERSKCRTRSRDHRSSRDREKSKKSHRSTERTNSKDRIRSKERDINKEIERSKEESTKHSSRSSRIRRNSEEKIDKQKLLEIARKNALNMMKKTSGAVEQTKVAITSGGKTVLELTDFCKLLSKKDADGHESISSNTSQSSDSESEAPFHHPFQIKDRPSSIVLNIRNSVALPVKSLQEKTAEQSRQLRLQFPVSSGQHHRKTESEWIPVSPKKQEEPSGIDTQVAVIKPVTKRVFKDTPEPPSMDIGSIVSQRLSAIRKLQENPSDPEALTQMYAAQQNMQTWAESKQLPPGHFTGSTGVKVLSQAELSSGFQAWTRKDQLQAAAPVNSGMGMALLQKMGWRPGEGLGKNKEGTLQPLLLEVKMDKKGLVAQEELPVRQPHQVLRGPVRSLEGKHPVSLLNEYCSRRKYGPPVFDLVDEVGPDHKKNFIYKVRVNGVEYKPAVGSPKKKHARAEAAEVCLKVLGVLHKSL